MSTFTRLVTRSVRLGMLFGALAGVIPVAASPLAPATAPTPVLDAAPSPLIDQNGYLTGESGALSGQGLQMTLDPDGRPRFIEQSAGPVSFALGDDLNWSSAFTRTGPDGAVNAISCSTTDCFFGGEFRTAGTVIANRIVRYTLASNSWSALGMGLNSSVLAVAVDAPNNRVFVGGTFQSRCINTECSNVNTAEGLNRVAMFDLATSTWSGLSNGLNDTVQALVVNGGDVYVGGAFTQQCATSICSALIAPAGLNRVARYNVSGSTWNRLRFGVNNLVRALAFSATSTRLYAGGSFTGNCNDDACTVGAQTFPGTNFIAAYNTPTVVSNSWFNLDFGPSSVGSGADGGVYAIALNGLDVYIGGSFFGLCNVANCSSVTPSTEAHRNISRFNGTDWFPLVFGVSHTVRALSYVSSTGQLIVGGDFFNRCDGTLACPAPAGESLSRIARFSSGSWNSFDHGVGFDGVRAIGLAGSDVVIGGLFVSRCLDAGCTSTDRLPLDFLARFNGSTWIPVAPVGSGPNDDVRAILVDGDTVYLGGSFTAIGSMRANKIARWTRSTNTWSTLGFGFSGSSVQSIVIFNGQIHVGGNFTGICANAECSGTPIREGQRYVARFDGTTWQPLGFGLEQDVQTLVVDGATLLLGGDFTKRCTAFPSCTAANGEGLGKIARWNGTTFSPLAFGLDDDVTSILLRPDGIYVAGEFAHACGNLTCSNDADITNGVNHVARFDGTAWQPLAFGVSDDAYAITLYNDQIVVSGDFKARCGDAACTGPNQSSNGVNHIARFDGSSWLPIAFGFQSDDSTGITAMLIVQNNLVVTGQMRALCNDATCSAPFGNPGSIARWNGSAWWPLGSGLGLLAPTADREIGSVLALSGGSLLVGGQMNTAGGRVSAFLAEFSGLANIGLTVTAIPDPVLFGQNLTYSVGISNTAPGVASGVVMTATAPVGLVFASASVPGGSCIGTTIVVCTVGNVAANTSIVATLTVTAPNTAGTLVATFVVDTASVDWAASGQSVTVLTSVTDQLPVIQKNILLPVAVVGRNITQ